MSLETAIEANTAAVRELIGMWSVLNAQAKSITTKVESGQTTAVPVAGVKEIAVAPAKKDAPVAAQAPSTEPAAQASAAPSAEITYEVVGSAITAAVKTRRDHVVAVLAKFGAKKGTELKAEQYADFMKALG